MADRKEYELLFKLNAQLGGSYNSTFKQGQASLASMQRELQALNRLQGDISSYQKQQSALANLKKQHDAIQSELQQTGNSSIDLKNKLLQKQLQIEKTAGSLDKLDNKLRNAGVDTSKLSDESRRLSQRYQQLASEQERYATELQSSIVQGESFGEVTSSSVMSVKSALSAAGIGVILHEISQELSDCVAESTDLETAIAKVQTVAGSGANMEKMSDDMIALSKATGKVATGLSDAAYEAISSGISAQNAAGFTEKAAKLAVGGFTDTANSVDILTTIINSYEKSASDAAYISDVLITTQNLGKTTVDKLASSMGMVIPTAAAYNTGLEDIATGYALMTARGMSTERTTTYINSMLNELGDSSSKVSKALKKVTKEDFAQLMGSGKSLGDVLAILGSYVKNNTTAFSNLWGSQEAQRAALSLLNVGAAQYNKTLDQMKNSVGATETAFQIMNDTTKASQDRYKAAADALKIAIGDKINPSLNVLRETGSDVLEGIMDLINGHKALAEQMRDVNKEYESNIDMTESSGVVALGYIDRLQSLELQGLKTKEAQEEYHNILEQLVTLIPDLRNQIDLESDSIEGGTNALRENTQEWMRNAVAKAYQNQFQQKMQAYVDTQTAYTTAKSDLNVATAQYDKLINVSGAAELAKALNTTIDALTTMSDSDLLASAPTLAENGISQDLLKNYKDYSTQLIDAKDSVEKEQQAVDDYKKQLELAKSSVDQLALSMGDLDGVVDSIVAGFGIPDHSHLIMTDPGLRGIPGYASGLPYVPYNNYHAMLHEGEKVLTANEARSYDRGGRGVSIQYNPTIYASNTSDLEAQLDAHANKIGEIVNAVLDERSIESQRRQR